MGWIPTNGYEKMKLIEETDRGGPGTHRDVISFTRNSLAMEIKRRLELRKMTATRRSDETKTGDE